jgi:hypothetical protein
MVAVMIIAELVWVAEAAVVIPRAAAMMLRVPPCPT